MFNLRRVILLVTTVFIISACGESDTPSEQSTVTETAPANTPPQEQTQVSPPEPVVEETIASKEPMQEPAESTAAQTVETVTPATEAIPEVVTEPAPPELPAEPVAEPVPAAPAVTTEALTSTAPIDGGHLYNTYCAICHKAGLNAAPKYGNKALWAKRIAQGRDTVYAHAINGLRGMTPRGGIAGLTDAEVKAAVDYMVNASGGWGSN